MPWIPTSSVPVLLKMVTPPHSIGAAIAGGISSGIYTVVGYDVQRQAGSGLKARLDDEVGGNTSIWDMSSNEPDSQ